MRHRCAEVGTLVALKAAGVGVLAVQRKFSFVVIECAAGQNRLPARSGMAAIAAAGRARNLR